MEATWTGLGPRLSSPSRHRGTVYHFIKLVMNVAPTLHLLAYARVPEHQRTHRPTHTHTHTRTVSPTAQGYVPAIPLPKYFASEWSFAQFRVHEEPPDPATGAPPPSIAGKQGASGGQ